MKSFSSLLTGILLTVLAGSVFAGMDSLGKHLTTLLPVLQVIWGRYFFQTLVLGSYLGATTGTRFLKARHPYLQLVRGMLLLAATICMYNALARVPLADATAVLFFTPIVVTILSVMVLKETIGIHRIGAIIAGFCGMLLILRPGFAGIEPALGFALAASGFNACYLLMTRRLAGTEDAASTQFNTTAAGAVILTLVIIPFWETPAPATLALLVLSGVAGSIGHFTLVTAFSHAPASLLSPFLYSQVLVASILSVVLFGDPLQPPMILGTVILVASGLYIWWRENR
ncbi:possible integral membrane protein [Aurantimonas manganoxydans SI85-9A1]|uniref:Possible integral membrane protein n=1 Tax=Aurantimonas manganoxydans (strain ATCC BAA-1229 / DSM 21871 / SI85-9A1) TaxID=287752 RepID=Q1YLH5_AURMS|nr:DMT family transporter [Aurantimonas manganoxydans]EAS51756.1 possible integral membrane protein [Aurantimonas manganoxydans SI85-9A1]